MQRNVILLFLLGLASCHSQLEGEQDLFGVSVGKVAPQEMVKGQSSTGPFLLVTVPSRSKELQAAMQDVNVFIFPDSHIVAGLRGDRAFTDMTSCNKAREVIMSIFKTVFPDAYSGNNARYQFQSKDGMVLAGVNCYQSIPFPQLNLEITDPKLEEKLMSSMRERR